MVSECSRNVLGTSFSVILEILNFRNLSEISEFESFDF